MCVYQHWLTNIYACKAELPRKEGEGEYSNSLEELVEAGLSESLARLGLPSSSAYQLAVAMYLLR